jgi:hypothetical protein
MDVTVRALKVVDLQCVARMLQAWPGRGLPVVLTSSMQTQAQSTLLPV